MDLFIIFRLERNSNISRRWDETFYKNCKLFTEFGFKKITKMTYEVKKKTVFTICILCKINIFLYIYANTNILNKPSAPDLFIMWELEKNFKFSKAVGMKIFIRIVRNFCLCISEKIKLLKKNNTQQF